MDINIDALYNLLKQNQRDVNDAMGSKKKAVVVTSDPLALIAKKTNVSRSKEKVVVSLDSKGSEADDFTNNNNLRTSSSSQSANKKQKFVKTDNKRVEKKDDEKKRDMSRVKCYNCKKEGYFSKYCKKAKEINSNMVFMAQIEKVLSGSEASSSSANEKISEVSYYLSESESESEFKTSEYYDNSTAYGLFVNNDDDQEFFHDAIDSASKKFIENHIDSQKDYDKFDVDHNDSEEKDQLEKYVKLEAERYEYMIRYSAYFDNDKQHRKQIADQQVLYDKMRPSHSAFVSATSASKKMSYGDSLNYSSTTTYSIPSNSKTVSHRSDVKGYTTFSSSQSAGPSHSAFVSATSASKKTSYGDSLNYSSTTTYSIPSNSKTGSHRSGNVIEDVLQSFVADTEPEQQLAYKDFKQIEKLDLEEMDLKWQMAMFNKKKVRCYKCQQRGHFARECRAKRGNDKQRYSSFKIKEIGKKEEDSKALITVDTLVDWTDHDSKSDGVIDAKEFSIIAGCDSENAIEEGAAKIYNLITGVDTEEASTGEFALMGVTSEVHNCPFGCDNKYNELNKQYNEFNEQNGEYFIQVQAYKNSLKTLEKQKKVLQRNQLTLEDKIRVLSIKLENTSNLLKHSKRINADVETAKKDLQTKLDNHLVQTENVSTFENEAEIECSVGTPIQEPIIVQDLPSQSCNSSDKNENTSRTSCNKNVVLILLRIVIFMRNKVNKTIGIGVGPVHSKNKVNHPNQFVPQAVLLRTDKVPIPLARPQPVPTGKPKVFAPVPAGRVFNSPMLHLLRVEMVINSPWIMPILGTKELASPEQTAPGKLPLMIMIGQREVTIHDNDWSKIMTTFIVDMLGMF
nr:ribonuclease H-like domain-containing protein [Tanacetum cinerariifolium]